MQVTALALVAVLVQGAGSAAQWPGGSGQCGDGVAVHGGGAAVGGVDCAGAFHRMTHHPDDAPPTRTTIQRFRCGAEEYRRGDMHQRCGDDDEEFGCDETPTPLRRSDSRVRGGYRPWMDSAAVDCDVECSGCSDESSCKEKCLNGSSLSDHEWHCNSRRGPSSGCQDDDDDDEADGGGTTTTSTGTATSLSSKSAPTQTTTPTTTPLVKEDTDTKSPLGLYLGAGLGVLVVSLLASAFFVFKAVRQYNRNRVGYPASEAGEGALAMLCDATVAGRAAEALELLQNPSSTDL